MSTNIHHHITYIEFVATDIEQAKQFYSNAFGWKFQDWGPEYASFSGAGVEGGFCKGEAQVAPDNSAPLIVIYSTDLKASEDAVLAAGGDIVMPDFEFPSGRRFHFYDGVGNVLAVWSEVGES